MKTTRKILTMHCRQKEEVIDITGEVEKIVSESGVSDGIALIFPHHTSASVYLSDSDPNLTEDFKKLLSGIVPGDGRYLHNETDFKKNACGHLKAILSGHNLTIPITGGKPDLGTYQTIYYFEFDGKRDKEIVVKIMGQ